MTSQITLADQIEALLFVANEPLTSKQLAAATGSTISEIAPALKQLRARLTGGVRLSELDSHYRLVTAPEVTTTVGNFLRDEAKTELSKAALETLAIVAYRGPITKGGIEQIRGVASETMLRNLLSRSLISEAGRASEAGRPQLYAVSQAFLQQFGLTSTNELPPLPDTGGDQRED
jgi:segregation and condensation protein B